MAARPGDKPKAAAPRGLGRLARALGHDFTDPTLLAEALTHRSAAGERDARHGFERLEFLGDRVLGLVVADLLFRTFPEEPEGALARRLAGLVRREALEKVADALGLGRYLLLAEAEERAGARRNRAIQADACEAVIGALYLDGGMEAARTFILARWQPLLGAHGGGARDAKTRLQEWAQARGLALPQYRETAREGPDHEPAFTIEVSIAGHLPATGRAPSKRAAEQEAAAQLLARIGGDADE